MLVKTGHATRSPIAEIERAARELTRGNRPEALLIYHDVAGAAGRDPVVQFRLGQLCLQIGDVDQSLIHFSIAAEERPENVSYLSALGIGYINSGQLEAAREALERALGIDADDPDVRHGLGVFHMRRSDYLAAREHLERASELKPGDGEIRTNLSFVLARLDDHELAIEHARKAIRLDPSNDSAHLALCTALTELGRMQEAVRHLEKTIRQNPAFGGAYDLLARIKKFSAQDAAFISRAEKALSRSMPPKERYCLHFALGKMHDDCGEFEKAFSHYEQANVLQKRDYDVADARRLMKDMQTAYRAVAGQSDANGHASDVPVFVVGMPRSGTTLIEQMIASHPRGDGAGELAEMPRIANTLFPAGDRRRIRSRARAELTADNIARQAEDYLAVLRQGRESADRIVDKMPGNFYFVGLIRILFPNSRIIYAMRHPLDTCLSCYFQSFAELPWSNDLDTIGAVYGICREAMAFWQRELPTGSILAIRYEELVQEPESHARRMIEFCGLEWDPAVLDFSRRQGVVKTASVAQTRQPMYQSSRQRWVNYAPHLGALTAQLADYLQDDREALAAAGIDPGRGSHGSLLRRLFS